MTGRSRFRFRFRGVMSLVKSIASQFFDILQKEEAASNTNVFYDPADLTSLRVGTDGSGGNPTVGDPVGIMLDTSQFGGKTAEDYLAGATELGTTAEASNFTAQNGAALTDVGGKLRVTGDGVTANPIASYSFSTVIGKIYQVVTEFDLIDVTANVWIGTNATAGNVLSKTMLADGSYTYVFTATATTHYYNFKLNTSAASSADLVSFSIKEIPGHHAIAPSDSARPVLFDDPDLTAAALTDNGQRGEELVTESGWSNPTGITQSENTFSFSSTTNRTVENGLVEYGSRYEVILVWANVTQGSVRIDLEEFNTTGVVSSGASGTASAIVDVIPGNGNVAIRPNAIVTGDFTLSVRKVLTAFDERGGELVTNGGFDTDLSDWNELGSSGLITWSGGSAVWASGGRFLTQYNPPLETGKFYEVTIDIEVTSGSLRVGTGALDAGTTLSSTGIHTFLKTPQGLLGQYGIYMDGVSGTFVGQVNSISVKELLTPNLLLTSAGDDDSTFDTDTGNWTKGTGWSIGSGVASCDGTQTGPSALSIPITMSANKFYKAQVYISSVSAGSIDFRIGAASPGTAFSTVGWHTFIARYTSGANFNVFASTDFVGSIDNVSLQELPASIDRKYYLDTDGVDDWMEVKPTLNLGEQWWHVGAWQADSDYDRIFATSNNNFGAARRESPTTVSWVNSSSSNAIIATGDVTESFVLTVEQSGTNSLLGRYNGSASSIITPYDDSGSVQGLALFSANNSSFSAGLDGRFYGGSWGQGQVDYDELTVLQDYLGTTTQPPIDPPDVTEYADVYELLAAQTGAVLFDIDDTTSLRVGRDGSGGVPVDGDPVGMMMDVSGAGGGTMAAYLEGATELVTNGTFDTDTGWLIVNSIGGGIVISGGVLEFTGPNGTAEYDAATATNGRFHIIQFTASANGTLQINCGGKQTGNYITFNVVAGVNSAIIEATNTHSNVVWFRCNVDNDYIGTIDNVSVKEISSHAAIAPSDSARPTLASYNSPISSREVLTTTYGWNITDGGRA